MILDDALAALEEPAQQSLLAHLRTDLPDATIISLGQRPAVAGVHDTELVLERSAQAARLVPLRKRALAEANAK